MASRYTVCGCVLLALGVLTWGGVALYAGGGGGGEDWGEEDAFMAGSVIGMGAGLGGTLLMGGGWLLGRDLCDWWRRRRREAS